MEYETDIAQVIIYRPEKVEEKILAGLLYRARAIPVPDIFEPQDFLDSIAEHAPVIAVPKGLYTQEQRLTLADRFNFLYEYTENGDENADHLQFQAGVHVILFYSLVMNFFYPEQHVVSKFDGLDFKAGMLLNGIDNFEDFMNNILFKNFNSMKTINKFCKEGRIARRIIGQSEEILNSLREFNVLSSQI